MRTKVTLKQKYNEIVIEFRGWVTAREFIQQVLMYGEDITVTIESVGDEEPVLLEATDEQVH